MTALPSTDRPLTAGDGWIEWHGGENPVPGQRVDVRLRNGLLMEDCAELSWSQPAFSEQSASVMPSQGDIIAYRLSRPVPVPEAGEGVESQIVVDWVEHTDDIADAISDSLHEDWDSSDGARAVVRWLNENAPYSRSAYLAQDLIQALALDQGEAAHPAFGLAVRLKTALHPAPADRVAELEAALDTCSAALQRLHTDIDALMADSEGVAGLHRNGEVAPWSDLQEGGQYADWLGEPLWAARNAWSDARRALLSAQPRAKGEG